MKYKIDASIFYLNQRSIGVLNGYIDIPTTPCIGSHIVLIPLPERDCTPATTGFIGNLKVEQILIPPTPMMTTLMLEDIVIEKEDDIEATITYLEAGFDFYIDRTELNPE